MKEKPIENLIFSLRRKVVKEINYIKDEIKSISRKIDHDIKIRFEDQDGNDIFWTKKPALKLLPGEILQLKPTYTSEDLNRYLIDWLDVPVNEIQNVIRNPHVVEGFLFKVIKVSNCITVYESYDHDGMNDDEVECVIIVSPFTFFEKKVFFEKFKI